MQYHYMLPLADKNHQPDYPPATFYLLTVYMVNYKLHLYFPGWVGEVVISKLNANLSSNRTELGLDWN